MVTLIIFKRLVLPPENLDAILRENWESLIKRSEHSDTKRAPPPNAVFWLKLDFWISIHATENADSDPYSFSFS